MTREEELRARIRYLRSQGYWEKAKTLELILQQEGEKK